MRLFVKLLALAAIAATIAALGASQSASARELPDTRPDLVVRVDVNGIKVVNIGIMASGPFQVRVEGADFGDGCHIFVPVQVFNVPSLGFLQSYPIPAFTSYNQRLITADVGNRVFEKNEGNNTNWTPSINC